MDELDEIMLVHELEALNDSFKMSEVSCYYMFTSHLSVFIILMNGSNFFVYEIYMIEKLS